MFLLYILRYEQYSNGRCDRNGWDAWHCRRLGGTVKLYSTCPWFSWVTLTGTWSTVYR